MARTWAETWEAEWAGEGCPKCAQGRPDQDEYGVRWYADEFADAYLLRQTPSPGYSAVIFRGRHVPDLALFTDAEVAGYWAAVRTVGAALYRVYSPAQINYLSLNNAVPHVHTHVLPRYADDAGPRAMLPAEAFDCAQILEPSQLESQVGRLKAALQS